MLLFCSRRPVTQFMSVYDVKKETCFHFFLTLNILPLPELIFQWAVESDICSTRITWAASSYNYQVRFINILKQNIIVLF